MKRTANPMLRLRQTSRESDPKPDADGSATVKGTVRDSVVLAALMVLAFAAPLQRAEWQPLSPEIFFALGAGVTLIYGAVMYVRRSAASFAAAIYAMGVGLTLGGLCAYLERVAGGVWGAVMVAPLVVFMVMLWMYGIVLVSPERRLLMWLHGVIGGTFVVYLFTVVRHSSHGNLPTLIDAPWQQTVVVVATVCLASFCYLLDFGTVDRGLAVGAPRRFQWYCAVGLVTTQLWMFPELVHIATHWHVRVRADDDDGEGTNGGTPSA